MNDDGLPESLVQDEEDGGFVDLDLRLVRLDVRPDGTFLAVGRGRHASRTLGFALQLDAEWKATPIGESDSFFYWGSGTVRSSGLESDVLLATLAELYDISVPTVPMRLETKVAVVGLGDDPRLLPDRPTHMKLFFENEDSDRYAEVYVNVIAPEQRIELHEKDPEYRKPLLRALGDGAG
ncbi:MAG TPA: hypothetical protein VKI17_05470 [Gemmataceae bacterium]|nr:hypothetical protein [Gemmataceae bacterium]